MDPTDPSTLYAMTNNGLYRSEDAGTSWTLASPTVNLTGQVALAVDPARPWKVYSGSSGLLERSDDRGRSWTGYPNPLLLGLNGLAVAPGRPSILFASAGTRLLRSEDEGESWEILPFDQPSRNVAAVGATWRSRDGGRTWTRLSRNARPEVWVRQLAVHPDDPETVYAATDHGVRVSRNGGVSWLNASAGLPAGPGGVLRVMSILVDPWQPETLYAGILPESPSGEPGVARSWNGGRRWQLGLQRGLTAAHVLVRLDRATPGTIYAVAGQAGGWPTYVRGFRSQDRGRRWEPFPLPPGGASDLQIAPGAVYAGNEKGVWRSRDGGRTWHRVDRAPAYLLAVAAVDPLDPDTVYTGAQELLRSTDGGRTWETLNDTYAGVSPFYFRGIAVSPWTPGKLYAWGAGLFELRE